MDLIILAAGKGSRMNSSLPKALHTTINGKNNIQNTIDVCGHLFEKIGVVVNKKDTKIFSDNIEGAEVLPISSGLGSGHALKEVIDQYSGALSDDFVLIWGDAVVVSDELVEELLNYNATNIIPVSEVENPYVSFRVNTEFDALSVDFSKYGETNKIGLQDKCIFKLNKNSIGTVLDTFHSMTFKNGRYITESNEFEFLYSIHAANAILSSSFKCYITDYNSIVSYNTKEELNEIIKLLS